MAYESFNCSHLLPRHPQVLQRLRDEIQSVAGDNEDLKREDIKKMTYLANVLKESMLISSPSHGVGSSANH